MASLKLCLEAGLAHTGEGVRGRGFSPEPPSPPAPAKTGARTDRRSVPTLVGWAAPPPRGAANKSAISKNRTRLRRADQKSQFGRQRRPNCLSISPKRPTRKNSIHLNPYRAEPRPNPFSRPRRGGYLGWASARPRRLSGTHQGCRPAAKKHAGRYQHQPMRGARHARPSAEG